MTTGPGQTWVPITVAGITAISGIVAAVIMRPPSPAPAPAPAEIDAGAKEKTSVTVPTVPSPNAMPSERWRNQVLANLDSQHKTLTDAGYNRDTGVDDWIGLLRIGAPKLWEVELVRGGDYQAVGVCDADCKDVDMEIYGPAGERLGGDVAVDDYPRVAFRPTQSGPHTIKVWLRQCVAEDGSQSCAVAARILRR